MRILILIPHYCGAVGGTPTGTAYGSQMAVAPRVFALSEAITALKRHFGERRYVGPFTEIASPANGDRKLDIVIVTVEEKNVLNLLDIDPGEYQLERYSGEPMFLGFETQRIARERAAGYDIIGMMEDDLIINDAMFLDKIAWFNSAFGDRAVLQPQRVEVSRAGIIAKTMIEPSLPNLPEKFVHADAPKTLEGTFAGKTHHFAITTNPHAGCWFLTRRQLEEWSREPYFYDRKAAWVGPLESAATRALALKHDVYRAVSPDPFFLEIEHFGVRFANEHAVGGLLFRDSPFLKLKRLDGRDEDAERISVLSAELAKLRAQHRALGWSLNSRTKLMRQLVKMTLQKGRVGRF